MVHYGKTQSDELQIIVSDDDIEALRQTILSASLEERRVFFGLKKYIEDNFTENELYGRTT